MKGFALTNKGIEDISKLEIKELIKTKKITSTDKLITFDFNNFEDLFLLCYKTQSLSKVGLLLEEFSDKKDLFEAIATRFKTLDLKDWLDKKTKVAVNCSRFGDHLFTSQDVLSAASKTLRSKKIEIDYKNPDLTIFVFINQDNCMIGIDFSGVDLSKRDYKIFVNQRALKANIAYSLLKIADIKKSETLLDPFVKSGEIIIEAALFFSNLSPLYYNKEKFAFLKLIKFKSFDSESFFQKIDKKIKKEKFNLAGYDSMMRNIVAANKNAKIAGINKLVKISRIEIDWVDLKFKKHTVDKIVTQLPPLSKRVDHSVVKKIYDHFFNQSDYILKKSGKIVIACLTDSLIKETAKNYNLALKASREIWQGKQKINVFVFMK